MQRYSILLACFKSNIQRTQLVSKKIYTNLFIYQFYKTIFSQLINKINEIIQYNQFFVQIEFYLNSNKTLFKKIVI